MRDRSPPPTSQTAALPQLRRVHVCIQQQPVSLCPAVAHRTRGKIRTLHIAHLAHFVRFTCTTLHISHVVHYILQPTTNKTVHAPGRDLAEMELPIIYPTTHVHNLTREHYSALHGMHALQSPTKDMHPDCIAAFPCYLRNNASSEDPDYAFAIFAGAPFSRCHLPNTHNLSSGRSSRLPLASSARHIPRHILHPMWA